MIRAALIYALLSGAALAGPDTSLRPPALAGGAALTPQGSIATLPRNAGAKRAIAATGGIASSLRPSLRSRKAEQAAKAKRRLLAKGAVCGDISIQGKAIGRVQPKLKGCGVSDAVQIQSVSGVRLSQAAVMDCKTAKALKTWIDQSAKPAFAGQGGLRGLRVAAHYACRTRNNQKGERISEHGKGRAIDIAGFTMKDGSRISVLDGWNAKADAKPLRQMHAAACGPFGTVLGPNANSFHRDHFHFDTARYRSGSYCR